MISYHRSNISRVVLVGLSTHVIVLIILSIFPTMLLLFAQPANTFALLLIHVALFYTETVAGILVIEQLNTNIYMYKSCCCVSFHGVNVKVVHVNVNKNNGHEALQSKNMNQ